MIFARYEYLAVSIPMTLPPGTIITTGTPGSVAGFGSGSHFLMPGDTTRTKIEKVGYIENLIVADA
jgi:2-keto-4-pentenoate hydratase/2-oxohepta-3-ene-1,7-dioic acid hydratase in catechol pathway